MSIENIIDEYNDKKKLLQLWTDIKNYEMQIEELKSKLDEAVIAIKAHQFYNELSASEKTKITELEK